MWLEQVFRDNVEEGQEEFTLQEFKNIVPSKNVRYNGIRMEILS